MKSLGVALFVFACAVVAYLVVLGLIALTRVVY